MDDAVDDGGKFIAAHHAIALELTIGIAFEDAVTGKLCHIFIGPMVFCHVREELALHGIDLKAMDGFKLGNFRTLFSKRLAHIADFLCHGNAGIGDVVVLAQFKGDASIDHVFTTAHGAADAEHDIFSRTIESPEGNGVAAAVVAVAASKIPLVIWIEVVGVESGKGGRIGTGMADPIVKVVDAAINPVEFLLDIDVHAAELADVDRIGRRCTRRNVVDLVLVHVDVGPVFDLEFTAFDGEVISRDRLTRYGVQVRQIRSKLNMEASSSVIRCKAADADVVVSKRARSSAL